MTPASPTLFTAGERAVFIFALVVSTILLLAVNGIAWRAKHPVRPIVGTALGFLVFSFLCIAGFVFLPPVALQAALMVVVALIWGATQYRPRFFLGLSCAATLVAFVVPGFFAVQETRQLQEQFPYVSMDERLSTPKVKRHSEALPSAATDQLVAMEARIEEKDRRGVSDYRRYALRQIHEETVQVFVTRPGFGISRMTGMSEAMLRSRRQEAPIPQPGTPSASPWLPEQLKKEPAGAKWTDELVAFHRDSTVDFVNVGGFGYIKDRQHVAGFQEHQISKNPTPEQPWTLETLDLVGLLLHDKPIAYVSARLPRMEELRAAPTRDLDDFETAGLSALQHGEELFVRERRNERHMLGAIRAVRQCLSCHEVERGDLLGAFSYRMTQSSK